MRILATVFLAFSLGCAPGLAELGKPGDPGVCAVLPFANSTAGQKARTIFAKRLEELGHPVMPLGALPRPAPLADYPDEEIGCDGVDCSEELLALFRASTVVYGTVELRDNQWAVTVRAIGELGTSLSVSVPGKDRKPLYDFLASWSRLVFPDPK